MLLLLMRGHAVAFVGEMIFVCLMFRSKGTGNLFFFHLSCGIVFLPNFTYPLLLVVLKIMFQRTWNFQFATICFTQGIVKLWFFILVLGWKFSALNHDLFKRNCSASSVCLLCSALVEDVKPLFFYFAQVLLLGTKHCFHPLHTFWEIQCRSKVSYQICRISCATRIP